MDAKSPQKALLLQECCQRRSTPRRLAISGVSLAKRKIGLRGASWPDPISHCSAQTTRTTLVEQKDGQAHSWTLFNILVQSAEGRALSVLMNVEQNNGGTLVVTYELRIGGRWTSMLRGIIGPDNVKEEEFVETLESWEVLIRRYEEQSGEDVTGVTRCGVVMKFAPKGIPVALRTASSAIGTHFDNKGLTTKQPRPSAYGDGGKWKKG